MSNLPVHADDREDVISTGSVASACVYRIHEKCKYIYFKISKNKSGCCCVVYQIFTTYFMNNVIISLTFIKPICPKPVLIERQSEGGFSAII